MSFLLQSTKHVHLLFNRVILLIFDCNYVVKYALNFVKSKI
jgi:hypothetical protein